MDIREQQIELLVTVNEYAGKLVPAMKEVIGELKGEQKEDTVAYLGQIIDGLNFVIEAYNVTKDLINEEGNIVDEKEFEDSIQKLSKVMMAKEYDKAADVLDSDIVPFLEKVEEKSKAFA